MRTPLRSPAAKRRVSTAIKASPISYPILVRRSSFQHEPKGPDLRCATRGKCRAALERRRIVAGAARGIGTEIARGFAREGAKVCIADRILEAAQAAAAKIENEG